MGVFVSSIFEIACCPTLVCIPSRLPTPVPYFVESSCYWFFEVQYPHLMRLVTCREFLTVKEILLLTVAFSWDVSHRFLVESNCSNVVHWVQTLSSYPWAFNKSCHISLVLLLIASLCQPYPLHSLEG